MKKPIAVLLTVCLLLGGASACDKADTAVPNNRVTVENKPTHRVFATQGVLSAEDAISIEDTVFIPSEQIGIINISESNQIEQVKQTIVSPFGVDKRFEYEESRCYFKDSRREEYGSFYSIYDTYKNATGDRIVTLHGTDVIAFYTSIESTKNESKEPLSEDQIRVSGETFLRQILPREYFESLTYGQTEYVVAAKQYAVSYRTMVEGYSTDDDQVVFLDECGNIVGYHGYDTMKYDNLKDTLTATKLEQAEQALDEKIGAIKDIKIISIGKASVTTNRSGHPYMSKGIVYELNGFSEIFTLYTNIL